MKMERYELKKETKIMKALSRFFKDATDPKTDVTKEVAKMTEDNVCLVEAKTPAAKFCLNRFIEKDEVEQKIPKLKYGNNGFQSKYPENYILRMSELFNIFKNEGVVISMNEDMPITMENSEFKVILAPRIKD